MERRARPLRQDADPLRGAAPGGALRPVPAGLAAASINPVRCAAPGGALPGQGGLRDDADPVGCAVPGQRPGALGYPATRSASGWGAPHPVSGPAQRPPAPRGQGPRSPAATGRSRPGTRLARSSPPSPAGTDLEVALHSSPPAARRLRPGTSHTPGGVQGFLREEPAARRPRPGTSHPASRPWRSPRPTRGPVEPRPVTRGALATAPGRSPPCAGLCLRARSHAVPSPRTGATASHKGPPASAGRGLPPCV